MSFKDSDFRSLVLTAAENLRSHYSDYGTSISQDEIARDLIVDRGFVNQLQTLIANCINEDESLKKRSSDSDLKRVDPFSQYLDDPLNW